MLVRTFIFFVFVGLVLTSPLSVDPTEEMSEPNPYDLIRITVISEHLGDEDEDIIIPELILESTNKTILDGASTYETTESNVAVNEQIANSTLSEVLHIRNSTGETTVEDLPDNLKLNLTVPEELHIGKNTKETLVEDLQENIKSNLTVPEELHIKNSTEETTVDNLQDNLKTNLTVTEESVAKNVTSEESDEESAFVRVKRRTEILNVDDIETLVTVKNNKKGTEQKFLFRNQLKVINGQRYSCKIGYRRDKLVFYNRCMWVGTMVSPQPIKDDTEDFFNFS